MRSASGRTACAGSVSDRAGDHHRQTHAALGEDLLARENGGLRVQRVEDGFDQDDIGAAVDQAADLFRVGDLEVVEGDGAVAGIVDVGRQGSSAVGRPKRARDEASLAVRPLRLDRRPPGETRAVAIEVIDHILHAIVGLSDRGGRKGVGFEDVRPSHGVGEVDVLDRLRLCQGEKVVVPLEVAFARQKAVAAEMGLNKAESLNLRAHRPIENQDPALRRLAQGFGGVLPAGGGGIENRVERWIH